MTTHADVMISYHVNDKEFVTTLAEKLKSVGISVYHKKLDSKSVDIANAVIHSKVFVQVMSIASAQDKNCKDELSLAYISNSSIFPVGLSRFLDIAQHLDSARKLMLAKINWSFFLGDVDREKRMTELVNSVKAELTKEDGVSKLKSDIDDIDELNFTMNRTRIINQEDIPDVDLQEYMKQVWVRDRSKTENIQKDFWDKYFPGKDNVPWIDFKEKFLEEYKVDIHGSFGEGKERLLCMLVYRDILEKKSDVKREIYSHFCGPNHRNDPDLFYNRVKDYYICIANMKEVFDMDSSVRLTAVQNMSSFKTPAVMATLMDLLEETDPNIRAVAALAIGKSGQKSSRIVSKLLEALTDEDRLVRESVCLALGHLKLESAISALLDVWRNDPISTVREAGKISIGKIGGEKAEVAMKVTGILSEEMTKLRQFKR